MQEGDLFLVASAVGLGLVRSAAGDLAGARGRRKEREKRGRKAVFFESGREAPAYYTT